MEYTENVKAVLQQLRRVFGGSAEDFPKLLSSFLIIIILWIVYYLINRVIHSQTRKVENRYVYRKTVLYLLSFLGLILVGRLWLEGFQPILTFLGIIAAALTITQKESLMNMTGMGFILGRNLFSVGDRIQVGEHKGDVIGIGIFYFTLMEVGNWVDADQSTGCTVKVPNTYVITTPIINYTKNFPYIWNELTVMVSMQSNWEKLRNYLLYIAKEQSPPDTEALRKKLLQSKDEVIVLKHFEPKVYIKIKTEKPVVGIALTIRYLCEARKRRDTENEIWIYLLQKVQFSEDIRLVEKADCDTHY